MIKGTYKRAELVIPKILRERFLSLSPEKQKEYLRLYREQVTPKFEELREATEGQKINLTGNVKTEMQTTEERIKLFDEIVGEK